MPKGIWWARLITLGFLNIGGFFYCLFYAATHLPGGIAALLMSCQPIIVMFLSWKILQADLSKQHLVAGILGILGISLLVINNIASLNIIGVIIALLGALSMALGVVLTKQWGRPSSMSVMGFTGWQLFCGGLLLLPITLIAEDLPHNITIENSIGYAYLCLLGAILSYFLWFRGIERIPATSVSFLGLLSSVSACILGYVILGEAFTTLQLIGIAVITASITLATIQSKAQPKTQ
jgi:probable blue pigment (indigoidine) exporter